MRHCIVCAKKAHTRCSRCLAVHYCSSECRKSHWKEHKKTCEPAPVQHCTDYYIKHKLEGPQKIGDGEITLTHKSDDCSLFVIKAAGTPSDLDRIDDALKRIRGTDYQAVVVLPFDRRDIVDAVFARHPPEEDDYTIIDETYGRDGRYENIREIQLIQLLFGDVIIVSPHTLMAVREVIKLNGHSGGTVTTIVFPAMEELIAAKAAKTLPKVTITEHMDSKSTAILSKYIKIP